MRLAERLFFLPFFKALTINSSALLSSVSLSSDQFHSWLSSLWWLLACCRFRLGLCFHPPMSENSSTLFEENLIAGWERERMFHNFIPSKSGQNLVLLDCKKQPATFFYCFHYMKTIQELCQHLFLCNLMKNQFERTIYSIFFSANLLLCRRRCNDSPSKHYWAQKHELGDDLISAQSSLSIS